MPKTAVVPLSKLQMDIFKRLMDIKPQERLVPNYKASDKLPTLDFAFPDVKIAIIALNKSIDTSKFEGWLFLRI